MTHSCPYMTEKDDMEEVVDEEDNEEDVEEGEGEGEGDERDGRERPDLTCIFSGTPDNTLYASRVDICGLMSASS
jgi:hypothetical protein